MKITFSPIRMDTTLIADIAGDVLTLNGTALDLSGVTDAVPLDEHDHPWIVGSVRRVAGEVQLTLLLPHGAHPPQETLFPTPVRIHNGPVPLPPYDGAAPDDAADLSGEGRDEP